MNLGYLQAPVPPSIIMAHVDFLPILLAVAVNCALVVNKKKRDKHNRSSDPINKAGVLAILDHLSNE